MKFSKDALLKAYDAATLLALSGGISTATAAATNQNARDFMSGAATKTDLSMLPIEFVCMLPGITLAGMRGTVQAAANVLPNVANGVVSLSRSIAGCFAKKPGGSLGEAESVNSLSARSLETTGLLQGNNGNDTPGTTIVIETPAPA